MRNQKILPRNNPSPAQSDRGLINVNEVIVWIRGVYGIENDGLYLDHYQRRTRCSKKDKSDHEKGNLQLTSFDRNTIHSESFGLNWTMKKKWTGSMTSPLRTVRLNIGGIGQDNGVEGGETKKWFTEKGTFAPIYFLINDLFFKAVLFRISRKFAASHNFLSSLLKNRRQSPKGGRFDTSRTFADFFVGSVRTPPLAWCG